MISWPATKPEPEVGVIMPQSMRMVVDLPEPLAPRNPKISPFFTEKVILLTATNEPNLFSRLFTVMESEVESVIDKPLIHLRYPFDHRLFQSCKILTHHCRS